MAVGHGDGVLRRRLSSGRSGAAFAVARDVGLLAKANVAVGGWRSGEPQLDDLGHPPAIDVQPDWAVRPATGP